MLVLLLNHLRQLDTYLGDGEVIFYSRAASVSMLRERRDTMPFST
jgi:hypothetical protein